MVKKKVENKSKLVGRKKKTSRYGKSVKSSLKKLRPPIVTIMGHVDHGKTTLLDYIKKSHLVDNESGGITQHIGAYQAEYQGKKITFIDTPGHAAFAKMRSRGAAVTDIIVLVIAATEGVKPQTVESINYIKAAGVPFIVALNKIDLPNSDPLNTKSELAKYDVLVEDFQGGVPVVEVSAKTGKNVDQLLEIILLISEMNSIGQDSNEELEAVVIESYLDKNKGPVATLLIRSGTLEVGDKVFVGDRQAKIRILVNDKGKNIVKALPSTPVRVSGFKEVPDVGMLVLSIRQEKLDKPVAEDKGKDDKEKKIKSAFEKELAALLEENEIEEPPSINIVLKADALGTLEAILSNLPEEVQIVGKGVGDVNESDVLLAAASDASIVAFKVDLSSLAKKAAVLEKVKINEYELIYKLLEDIEKIILKLLEPTIDEEELGRAEIVEIFEINKEKIAGCKVKTGEISKNDLIHLIRDEKIIGDVKIKSMKKEKEDVDKVKAKGECGLLLSTNLEFKKGDLLSFYKKLDD